MLALKLKPVIAEKAKENQGERTDLTSVRNLTNVDTKKELAEIAGVSHDTIAKVEKIEKEATPEVKAQLKRGDITINRAYQDIKRQEKREEISAIIVQPKPLNGKFDVIYSDCPWQYDWSPTTNRSIDKHYPTMKLEEIKSMEIPAEDDAVLFLWTTAPKLPEALEVMQCWGFEYKTNATWDKEKIGTDHWFRGQHELLLVGVKGNFKAPEDEILVSSVYREPRTNHSKKPDYYYGMIELMHPNHKYLELFARKKHSDKWALWGNQIISEESNEE